MPKRRDLPCPCGSGSLFSDCCQPLLLGCRQAGTAEQLMRSRYTAFVRRDAAYLRRSWHPDTRPGSLTFTPGLEWLGLDILHREAGGPTDEHGRVTFRARGSLRGQPFEQRETSRFVRVRGRWVYLDGAVSEPDPSGAGA